MSLPVASDLRVLRLGRVHYDDAWTLQRQIHAQRVADDCPDTLLLLEHDSVYTAGRRTQPQERPLDGTPVLDVDRGGKITWHGPGQLVGYPIVRLPDPMDVVGYVRRLESGLMAACAAFGLATCQVPGRSGVWTTDGARKLAAIGVRVAQRVTMHGLALNVCPDLSAFDRIVPCGLTDVGVTSLSRELARPVALEEVQPVLEAQLAAVLRDADRVAVMAP